MNDKAFQEEQISERYDAVTYEPIDENFGCDVSDQHRAVFEQRLHSVDSVGFEIPEDQIIAVGVHSAQSVGPDGAQHGEKGQEEPQPEIHRGGIGLQPLRIGQLHPQPAHAAHGHIKDERR